MKTLKFFASLIINSYTIITMVEIKRKIILLLIRSFNRLIINIQLGSSQNHFSIAVIRYCFYNILEN